MVEPIRLLEILGIIVVAAPALLVSFLGAPCLFSRQYAERTISKAIQATILFGLLSSLVILAVMLATGVRHVSIELGAWVVLGDFHFTIKFVLDRLSVPFVILTYVLTGTIAAFGSRYMHRERGYSRFFFLYALFVLGMALASLADTIETLFAGWELVGLSSALLVAFFQERPAPSRNGLRVWIVYRVSDAALILAAVILHHSTGRGDFDQLFGRTGSWPEGQASLTSSQALGVGLLLLLAAAGKSALVPFSGWLPRAMEGPTPSSAIFYGALSVHLGAFLLLRVSPILECSFWLSAAVVSLGLLTTVTALLTRSVQTDIKSALSYASLAQVGLIVAEIGFGLRYIALIHILGHACLRTLQFLRAPTLLHDHRVLENAIGAQTSGPSEAWDRICPRPIQNWLYRLGLERSYFDSFLMEVVVVPYVRVLRFFDDLESRWTDFLAGSQSREAEEVKTHSAFLEELP